jgi:hypothetical protein
MARRRRWRRQAGEYVVRHSLSRSIALEFGYRIETWSGSSRGGSVRNEDQRRTNCDSLTGRRKDGPIFINRPKNRRPNVSEVPETVQCFRSLLETWVLRTCVAYGLIYIYIYIKKKFKKRNKEHVRVSDPDTALAHHEKVAYSHIHRPNK